jgi:flagellar biosynthesis/type III secretory pathway M-ring protein FliF/YscJ
LKTVVSVQMVGFTRRTALSSDVGGSSSSKRAFIVTGVTAAVLLVVVAIVAAILYVEVFNKTTGLQVSHGK